MFVKKTLDCDAFVANDGSTIRELLHSKNDTVDLPYSLALATVDIGKQTYKHKLEQTEVYLLVVLVLMLAHHGQKTVMSE